MPGGRARNAAAKAKLTADEETPADARARRTLRRNNTESIVQRTLNEQFSDFSDFEKDVVKVGGKTLRERLAFDKNDQRHNSETKLVRGNKYYEDRRREYSSSSGAASHL